MKIIWDTSALLALFSHDEDFHEEVSSKSDYYQKLGCKQFVHRYVLSELFTRLVYDYPPNHANAVIQAVEEILKLGEIQILEVDDLTWQHSLDLIRKYSDKKISFCDALTFTVYKNLNIDEIFTLDSDFKRLRAKTSF